MSTAFKKNISDAVRDKGAYLKYLQQFSLELSVYKSVLYSVIMKRLYIVLRNSLGYRKVQY